MSATDELRRLLDERGVEHEDKHTELAPGISDWDSTWWQGIAGMTFLAVSDEACGREGCVYINGTHLTPEQAIAATLGNGMCRLEETEWVSMQCPMYRCSECDGMFEDGRADYRYCPYCGAKVVER